MRFALKQCLFVYAKRQTIIALHLKHYLFPPVIPTDSDARSEAGVDLESAGHFIMK